MHVLFIGRGERFVGPCAAHSVSFKVMDFESRRHLYPEPYRNRVIAIDYSTDDRLYERVLELHERRAFDRIVSIEDYGMASASIFSKRLGLPHTPLDVILNTRDKARMRALLTEASLNNVPYRFAECGSEAERFANECGYPLIVKPADESGSFLVSKVHDVAELRKSFDEVIGHGKPRVLLERYIEGSHYGVVTYSTDGTHTVVALVRIFHDPQVAHGSFVSIGQFVEPAEADEVIASHGRSIDLFLDCIGVAQGPCWTEFRRGTNGDLYIIETQNRYPAGFITDLIQMAYGFDVHELYLRDLVGELEDLRSFARPEAHEKTGAAVRFFTPDQGWVESVERPAERLEGSVVEYELALEAGSRMSRIAKDVDRKGHVIATGSSGEEAYAKASAVVEATRFVYRSD